ncbi:unnamed protein product, partial [Polarella glacialis]
DQDMMPASSRALEVDPEAHWTALIAAERALPRYSADRLRSIDSALDKDALWPTCGARVALAQRLRPRGALRKRCERQFDEVLLPLIGGKVKDPGPSGEANSSASILFQARQLLEGCAQAWLAAVGGPEQ